MAGNVFKTVKNDKALVDQLQNNYPDTSVYFPAGKESFGEGLKAVDLNVFAGYEEAYTKLVIDLTALCFESIGLVIPENDETEILYVSGGFARNEIFIELLKKVFPEKSIDFRD